MRTLHLTLHRRWFDAIAQGAKSEEHRSATPYWAARLEGKAFDVVRFRNGYSPHMPTMEVKCVGIEHVQEKEIFTIHLGKILSIINYP